MHLPKPIKLYIAQRVSLNVCVFKSICLERRSLGGMQDVTKQSNYITNV